MLFFFLQDLGYKDFKVVFFISSVSSANYDIFLGYQLPDKIIKNWSGHSFLHFLQYILQTDITSVLGHFMETNISILKIPEKRLGQQMQFKLNQKKLEYHFIYIAANIFLFQFSSCRIVYAYDLY